MPLKDLGPRSKWHWREAIAWIAFDIPDASSSFSIKHAIEQIGIEKLEAENRACRAIELLVEATKEDRLIPIWTAPWPGDLDFDKSDAPFKRWAHKTEEKMLEGLKGIITSSYSLDGLFYDRAAILKGWPDDLAEGAEQDEPGPPSDSEIDVGQGDAREAVHDAPDDIPGQHEPPRQNNAANPATPDEHEITRDEPGHQTDAPIDIPQGDTQASEVAPAAPTPTTDQTTDGLKAWFVDVYVPAHKDDTPNPTRDDALTAARPVFKNYVDLTHLRDDLREIWGTHAPEGWRTRGPRPKPE